MVLLCGAPSSGKTTISKGIKDWIKATAGPNDQCFHVDFRRVTLDDEATMWQSLCWCMGVEVSRDDQISFLHALAELPGQWHFIVDHMERVLTAPALAACFLNALREAKRLPNFGGFLGVWDYGKIPSMASANHDLFHGDMVISTEPFSERQMLDLFTRVRLDKSLYDDFMVYSGGSPGVLGSLLKLTFASCQTRKKCSAWKLWFEAEGFARYVSSCLRTCTTSGSNSLALSGDS